MTISGAFIVYIKMETRWAECFFRNSRKTQKVFHVFGASEKDLRGEKKRIFQVILALGNLEWNIFIAAQV